MGARPRALPKQQVAVARLSDLEESREQSKAARADRAGLWNIVRQSEEEMMMGQGMALIENFLDDSGKWHPQRAQIYKELGADMDYSQVWQFPCCEKYATGYDEPSQFRADGCQSEPGR